MEGGARIAALEEENQKLKEDNEKLMKIIAQMNVTLNRLMNRCLTTETQEISTNKETDVYK